MTRRPEILTLRCRVCGGLRTLRGRSARLVRDAMRAFDGRDVEYGDSVTIDACTEKGCLRRAFEACLERGRETGRN